MKTYISLFSSAGVGCYAFKKNGFECIATNELIERRLNIQKHNKKCKYESGYIDGDITKAETKQKIFDEIKLWRKEENLSRVDVVMATPPCQGMSTANYKKGDETGRNSLVVEAIHLVKDIQPRVFLFENVRAFLTTNCADKDGDVLEIKDCIYKHLSSSYDIYSKVINFMDYGIPSSRPRTIVIGVLKSELNLSPLNLFPIRRDIVTLRDVIGELESLQYGEKCATDPLHSFRKYPEYMQEWIHDLDEGESAFSNEADKLPYKIVDGKRQILKSGHMGNKFRRMYWDRPAPCITTRNDQLASQSTIHPKDDRVLTIRELMRVMSIPDDFKWTRDDSSYELISQDETLIRQSIGEAVPTGIINQIASNISLMLEYSDYVETNGCKPNPEGLKSKNPYIRAFAYEMKLADANETGSFYTPQKVVYNTIKNYSPKKDEISILEPAVGMGAFIPQMLRLVDDCKKISITCVDISKECLKLLSEFINKLDLPKKFSFKFICNDFITARIDDHYDAIVANPPYFKMKAQQKKSYSGIFDCINDDIYCLFLKRFASLSDEIMVVLPKTFLMIPDCNDVREIYAKKYGIVSIYDYGVSHFKKVFVEIISIHFKKNYRDNLYIKDLRDGLEKFVSQGYIQHDTMWLLYRDKWFDEYIKTLSLDVFDFYRDRQLSNKYMSPNQGKIWVIRSKNLLDSGEIVHKDGYDRFVDSLSGFNLEKYLNKSALIFTNFTYNTRAAYLPNDCTVNGSLCVLLPKNKVDNLDLALYSSEDFRKYYAIVKNKSRFTINVDINTIHYIGVKKNAS